MSIITGRRRERAKDFVTIENSMFEDSRLSWKAKGLLGYLLTKPNGWTVRIKDLEKHGTDGERKIRAGLKELQEFGYLSYKRIKAPNGKFIGIEWEYDDIPFIDDSPETVDTLDFIPHVENSNVDEKPHVEKPHVQNSNVDEKPHVQNARVDNAHVQNRPYITKTNSSKTNSSNTKKINNSPSLVSATFGQMDSLDEKLKEQYPDVPFEEIKANMLESADKGELNIYTGKQYLGALKYRIEDWIRSKRFPKAKFGTKGPTRTEYIPKDFDEPYKPASEVRNEDEIEKRRMIIELKLKLTRKEITLEQYNQGVATLEG